MALSPLLFWPNIVGYGRIMLILVAFLGSFEAATSISIYIVAVILDAFDGYLARTLNQVSRVGALIDVVVDNLGRTCVWAIVAPHVGPWVSSLEWVTLVCLHQRGPNWKAFEDAPWLCKLVMANGFKTPLGAFVIAGIHFLPVALFLDMENLGKFTLMF